MKQLSGVAEYDPVGQIATRSSDLPTEHHQFVAQHEDFDRVPVVRSATWDDQFDEAPKNPIEDGSDHPMIVPAATRTMPLRVLDAHRQPGARGAPS
jgi:hypothetical protein